MAVVIGLGRWSAGWRLMAIRAQQEAKVDSSSYECCFHFLSSFFLKIFNFIFFLSLLLFWNQIFRINWVKIESENWSILEKMQNQDQECSQIFYLTCCSDIAKVWKLVLIHLNYIDFSSIEITCSYIIYYILHYRVNHNQAPCNMRSV